MSSRTLKIRKLPSNLSNEEKSDLLKHFGALEVTFIGSKNVTAFALFESNESAEKALHRLHQLKVMDCLLSVVFASDRTERSDYQPVLPATVINKTEKQEDGSKSYGNFLQKLNSWSLGLDLTQPPPVHLRYQYPPPTIPVLANIARALSAVPKFYTQTLHLMNKMNLPSPFHSTFPDHQEVLHNLLGQPKPQELKTQVVDEVKSTSESELESDGETVSYKNELLLPRLPAKRRKIKTRPKFNIPQTQPKSKPVVPVEDVFEVPDVNQPQKKIELKLTASSVSDEIKPSLEIEANQAPPDPESSQGFGILFPEIPEQRSTEETSKTTEGDGSVIKVHQLRCNKVPERDRAVLSVFKGYQAGAPSCRLYVKNIAKTVTARELHYIFRAFLQSKESDVGFDIRHLTEGRMKGQAFVTYPTINEAKSALHEVNGYILNDKPVVVQFARSAKAKPIV